MHVKAHAKIVNIEHVSTVYRLVEQIQILDISSYSIYRVSTIVLLRSRSLVRVWRGSGGGGEGCDV